MKAQSIRFLLIIGLFACNKKQANPCIMGNKEIIGTWQLKAIYINNIKNENNDLNEISFFENGSYKQSSWSDDTGRDYTGVYFCNNNPKRLLRTITLVPDIIIENKDTVLLSSQNWDMSSLSTNEFIVCSPTEWVTKADGQNQKVVRRYYYKKKEIESSVQHKK